VAEAAESKVAGVRRRLRAITGREPPVPSFPGIEHHHRNVKGGGARAAVFGVSDGLVSNLSLILGVAGAHPAGDAVRVAGVAGLLGGAFSMAAGEYISMRAQRELLERELDIERRELARRPDSERRELVHLYQQRGLGPELAKELAAKMMATPEMALETHAREELGIDPSSLGSPVQAALSSFVAFSVGAVLPLLSFLFSKGNTAIYAAIAVAGLAAIAVGGALSIFTGRSWAWSAARQLLVCAAAGAVTFGVGSALGAAS
jgi:VIT1/CCC1 family predicted Fe2+/Mn2+ transporter